MSKHNPNADRSHGGPGSSQQDAHDPPESGKRAADAPVPGTPTNPDHSRVSGGGGERDRHHTHDPRRKG